MSLLLSKVHSLKLVYILEAIDIALRKQTAETANLLLDFMLSDEFRINSGLHPGSGDEQSVLLKTVFQNAIRLDSYRLINFLLRCTPKIALQLMDFNALLLDSIVQGSARAAKAFREYPWFRVSGKVRMFRKHWNRVLPHDRVCLHILAIFHRFLQLETAPLQNGVNLSHVTKRNWEVLQSTTSVVDFYLAILAKFNNGAELLGGSNIRGKKVPPALFSNLRMPLSADQRVLTYLILSGPHSPCIRSIYSTKIIRHYKFEGPLGPAGKGASREPEMKIIWARILT